MPNLDDPTQALAWLRTPGAIRERCHALLALGEADGLPFFTVDTGALAGVADYVADVIRAAYPDLEIPYHARWRHFSAGGRDRWGEISTGLADPDETARIRTDLAVVSVLLDAGAGPDWRYVEADGTTVARSEGLAVASLHAFRQGLFSGEPDRPLQADAQGLAAIDAQLLGEMFQVAPDNPLTGLEGRAALLRRLANALRDRPDLFGPDARIGGLFDHLRAPQVPATAILAAVLDGLGPVWPPRLTLAGVGLGDVWRHPSLTGGGLTEGLVPFHKLSQWLSYSLVEIFEDAGLPVTGLDELTGLPEYRNGGLFLDLGVLVLRDPGLAATPLPVDHAAIVEWRALTLALLDRVAPLIRERLGRTASQMPLARVLEGGTWAAGRRAARERRADGGPPLQVISDGTVF